METKGTTGEETISYWFELPIDVAEFEEKLGIGAESGDYRIIEKVLPYADEVHEHTSVYQLNELDFMYRQRKADGSATTGATRPHERPATASTIPKPSAEKMQEVKRPATATTSKASEPVKTNVIKERPLSSGASDKKATQSAQPVHRQNVEKVVSQETRQNYTKDRRTKVQQTQSVQKNQQTTEKTRNLVTKKGQKKK